MPKVSTTKKDKALRAAARALARIDRIMDFSNPDQLYIFNPTDEPTVQAAWRSAATALRGLK